MTQYIEDDQTAIEIEEQEPTFYARIPKMAIMDLGPYELSLYCHYREIIGSNESGRQCWMSNNNLAERTQMSVSRMKEARNKLKELGYIKVHHKINEHNNSEMAIITVRNIWAINHHRFMTQKEFETGVHTEGGSRQKTGGGRQKTTPQSPENHKEEPYKKNQEEINTANVSTKRGRQSAMSVPKQAVMGVSAITGSETKAYRSLETKFLALTKRTSLTESQRKILWDPVLVISREGSTSYKSPVDLYDDDKQYQAFAEDKIIANINASNGKAGTTSIVKALADYGHQHGWLAYQQKNAVPQEHSWVKTDEEPEIV